MVYLIDGHARGAKLNLRRIPKLLRVVIDTTGHVDALDLPTDRPRKNEKVYAYRVVEGTQISGFLCGNKRGCLQFNNATYKMCDDQPEDSTMRHRALWEQWVENNRNKLTEVF